MEQERKFRDRQFKIPSWKIDFPTKEIPLTNSTEENIWLNELFDYSLMPEERFRGVSGVKQLAALFHPYTISTRRYELIFKLYLIITVIDDLTETGNAFNFELDQDNSFANKTWLEMEKLMDYLIDRETVINPLSLKPYILYYYLIFGEIGKDCERYQLVRIAQAAKSNCIAVRKENEIIKSGKLLPNIEEFLEIRRESGVTGVVVCLTEFGGNLCISDDEWEGPIFRKLRILNQEILVMMNDIDSFEREYYNSDSKIEMVSFNCVALEARLKNVDIETAIFNMTEIVYQKQREFLDISKQIAQDNLISEDLKKYIEQAAYTIGGNRVLGKTAPRYNQFDFNIN